ncbi:MAG TPA: hypothetical protein VGQ46_03165 [Thermoanaerobaculia bacterium]|jgi:hypothetical protein|nr:hypothetical protein [Thermoanaerobaculia bacterium]
MKKLMVLALMATLLMAGSAFAVNRTSSLKPVPNATFQFGAPGVAFGPTTTNNDDSCDIGVAPAATLLLPYFEVDTTNRTTTTLFTITNVSRLPQIAHVTVWTDWSFPVLDFNIFLTGYDVQPINLLDILTTGTVGSASGTGPTTAQSPLGSLSSGYTNPNFVTPINCGNLPGVLPTPLVAAVRSALTTGVYNPGAGLACSSAVGGTHTNAIGYITIDVASNCSTRLPTEAGYFTTDVLYDNVFIGDYEQLGPAANGTTATSFDGAGNAMVHIRAVPEGGFAGTTPGTNLPYTFYDRYTHNTTDRRQPLPSTWAARYIQGGAGAFATNFKIWREGFGTGACGASLAANGVLPVAEIVRFDERENPFTFGTGQNCSPCIPGSITMPETSAQNTSSTNFPTLTGSDVGGWMYLNLNNGGSAAYTVTRNIGGVLTPSSTPGGLAPAGATTTVGPRPSQNWVIVEMFGSVGANRLSVDFDAAWLGNGCSPAAFLSSAVPIGPAGGVLVCPPPLVPGTTCAASPVGTNTTPLP